MVSTRRAAKEMQARLAARGGLLRWSVLLVVGALVAGGLAARLLPARAPSAPAGISWTRQPLPDEAGRPDWDAIKERTRTFNAADARHRALLPPEVESVGEAAALLDRVQASVGPRLGGMGRLAFPGACPPHQRAATAEVSRRARAAAERTRADRQAAEAHLEALSEAWKGTAPSERVRTRTEAVRQDLAAREQKAALLWDRIASGLELQAGGAWARLRLWSRQVAGTDPASAAADLRDALAAWGSARTPVLGAELTYVSGRVAVPALPGGSITPAYAAGGGSFDLDDSTAGREVELSPEVLERARALGTPKAAFDFVHDGLRLDWYHGSLKGSTETLRSLRGNDSDLATLLVALLRAQQVPARYVRGTIQLPVERLADLMGLFTAAQLDALRAGQPLPADQARETRDRVLAVLSAAGVPFETVAGGGTVTAVRFLHTWVEAFVAYSDYRGAGRGTGPRQWVPLDPAIGGQPRTAAVPPAADGLQAAGLDADALVRAYLAAPTPLSPLAFTRARVEAGLAATRPGLGWAQVLREVAPRPEGLRYLPGTLPFQAGTVHEELAFLPDSAKHRVRITATEGGAVLFDVTLPAHQLTGHRTLFTYKPATPEDEQLVTIAGGLLQAPAAAVAVVPVLRVDGQERAAGVRAVGLGVQHDWSIELLMPDGSRQRVDNRIIAGNAVAVGLGAPGNAFAESATAPDADLDGPGARFLYGRAAAYASQWTRDEEELARLLQVAPVHPTANLVLVSHQLAVDEALGVRRALVWKGLEVDADHRSMTPVELVPGRGKELLRLSGYQGSWLEASVLTEGTGVEAVSAVTAIQRAQAEGLPILEITPANVATELARLVSTADVVRDIRDQAAQRRAILVPQLPVAIQAWTGAGFIARDPATEEGGYFLSGHVSGGQTVVSPGEWTDEVLLDALQHPDRPRSTKDLTRVARIIKVPSTDYQRGVVGRALPQQLTVYVTTLEGLPVAGAKVVFERGGVSSPTLGLEGLDRVNAYTDDAGRATVKAAPDKQITGAWSVLEQRTPYDQLLGLNTVAVSTTDGVNTIMPPGPFTLVGLPDVPAQVVLPCDRFPCPSGPAGPATSPPDAMVVYGLEDTVPLSVTVTDQYGNAIANRPVVWSQSPGGGAFIENALSPAGTVHVLDAQDPAQFSGLLQVSRTDGQVITRYIPGIRASLYTLFSISATTPGADGPLSSKFDIWATMPGPSEHQLRMRVPANLTGDGIYLTDFPNFVGAQVLAWGGPQSPGWAPLGSVPGAQVQVRQTVTDESKPEEPVVLDSAAVDVASTNPRAPAGMDDVTTAVFLPTYQVDGGQQRLTYGAKVVKDDGTWTAVTGTWTTAFASRRPTTTVQRVLPGGNVTEDSLGLSSADDPAVAVTIANPASYPIFCRITETPTVEGEKILAQPLEPGMAGPGPGGYMPGDARFPGWIQLMGHASWRVVLSYAPNHGGNLKVELATLPTGALASSLSTISYATKEIRVLPPGTSLVTDEVLRAKVILPVRNPESTESAAAKLPPDPTEQPILTPATLEFRVTGSGTVTVTTRRGLSPPQTLAAAVVSADADGIMTSLAPVGLLPMPQLMSDRNTLRMIVQPGDPAGQDVTLTFHTGGDVPDVVKIVPLRTDVYDMGAAPVGHTFVKNVSVVDGHLFLQGEDLRVAGRGAGLAMSRSYTSRGFERGPLGMGWTHGWRAFAMRDTSAGAVRFSIVGGEGTGQMFAEWGTSWRAQRGFHGTLRVAGEQVTYRALSGTEYRFGTPLRDRYRLEVIVDPRGHTTTLEYGDSSVDGEVVRVYEPGNARFLQFTYDRAPAGIAGMLLRSVELMANRSAPGRLAGDQEGAPLGVCIGYAHDGRGQLTEVARHDGGCDLGPVVRLEAFSYLESPVEALQNNIARYTDPNGNVVEYAWYGQDDRLPGEGGYVFMGDRAERVKAVREMPEPSRPGEQIVTGLVYSLVPSSSGFGTTVTGPRPGQETTYRFDRYGAASQVTRALAPGVVATTGTVWDTTHIKPKETTDPLGRVTSFSYDAGGNLLERTTSTSRPAGAPSTLEALHLDGAAVPSVADRWAYDPDYGGETCHVDPEGRVTTTTYYLGLPQVRIEYLTPLAGTTVAGAGDCLTLAAQAQPSERDRIVELTYCGPAGCGSTRGGLHGDLASSFEHGRGAGQGTRRVRVDEYDVYGYQRVTTADPGGAAQVTTAVHDARGRLLDQADSLGHHTTTRYDGLDRPVQIDRLGGAEGSPGQRRALGYYDGGQLRSETVSAIGGSGTLLVRSIAIDGLGRPTVTSEQDLVAGRTSTTTVEYDEAGNRQRVTDRRGVVTRTVFDLGDRPVETFVSVPGKAAFEARGGDATGFEFERRLGRAGFDLAGNKTWEEDLHGHRTDYTFDTLYRVVRVTQPATPDELGNDVRHQVTRAYDRVGNKVLERDGNGHETRFTYDQANREVAVVDALQRSITREFDSTGALRTERTVAGGVEQLVRTLSQDGLGRPLDTTETWATASGTRSRTASTRYDDAGHRVLQRDARGVVMVTRLDALDRVMSTVADTTDGALARTFTAAPAVAAETRFEYDALGHRRATVDPLGRRAEEDVDAFGRTVARRLAMGVTETFTLDGEGQVIERRDGRGIRWRTYRDPLGRVTEESVIEADASQVPVRTGREAGELALKRSQYVDAATPVVYDLDARGHLTTRTLDALHREVLVVNAAGGSVETRYDAVNRRWLKDPRGYQTWLTYDPVNRPTGQEDRSPAAATLFTQSTTYRDATREEEHRSRAGRTTLTTRDGLGRAVKFERSGTGDEGVSAAAADLTEYDAAGNVNAQTDANGHVTGFELDGLGRKLTEVVAAGTGAETRTRFSYDAVGNRVEVKGPRGTWTYDLHQDFDDLNRPVRTVDAEGHVSTQAFDAAGHRLCELRPSGGDPIGAGGAAGKTIDELRGYACGKPASTGWAYDELGMLTAVTTAAGATSFVYDEARNLIAKQDGNEHLTVFGYDDVNRRTDEWQQLDARARLTRRSEVAPLQRSTLPDAAFTTGALRWHADYDLAGNVTQVTEPKGDVRTSTYGALNRLETVTFTQHDKPTGLLVPTSKTTEYDSDGQVRLATLQKVVWRTFLDVESSVSEEARSEYDGLGRLWRQHRYDGKVVEYAYDLKGNRSKVTDPDGVETSYAYDEADRLQTVTTPRGAVGYTYLPDGLRKATGLPNGLSEGRCYDRAGQVTAIVTRAGLVADTCPDTAEDRSRFRYAYDANGNRLAQQEWRTDPATQALGTVEETTYGYDGLDRLVGVQYQGGKAELYRLDAVGNRTGERELADAALSGGQLASYEPPAGATIVRDVTSSFNRADWLLALTDVKDPSRDVSLGWTASGELLTKTTTTVSRRLTWDGRGALVSVADNGTEVGRYDYDADGLRVKRKTAAEDVEYVLDEAHVLQEANAAILEHPSYRRYHYGAEPVLVVDGGTGRFIGTDALGSPTDLTSTTGRVEVKRQYDAWGKYRNGTAPGAGEAKLGFTGHQFDPETGLIYARARYYDPEIGRFISRDTYEGEIEDAPSLHRFAYANGNPLAYTDPDGNSAAEAADEWEKKQRKAAWTGEQVMGQAQQDSDAYGREAAARNGEGLWGALKTVAAQTVMEVAGGISAFLVDPTVAVRGVMRIGVGTAQGVEMIQQGKVAEGTLAIVADASAAAGTAAGMWGATSGLRAAVSSRAMVRAEGQAMVRQRVAQAIMEERAPTATVARVPTELPGAQAVRALPGRIPASQMVVEGEFRVLGRVEEPMPAQRAWSDFLPEAKSRVSAARAQFGEADFRMSADGSGAHPWSPTHGENRAALAADSHHIIQHAAAKTGPTIPGRPSYSYTQAPATQLDGPSSFKGSPHYEAGRIQGQPGGGSYGAERRIGYKALRKAGKSPLEARLEIFRADRYYIDQLGWDLDTPLQRPGNR